MSQLPIDIFFQTLLKADSKDEAFRSLKAAFIKRKLGLVDIIKYNVNEEFEELWTLIEIERCLKDILKSKE